MDPTFITLITTTADVKIKVTPLLWDIKAFEDHNHSIEGGQRAAEHTYIAGYRQLIMEAYVLDMYTKYTYKQM